MASDSNVILLSSASATGNPQKINRGIYAWSTWGTWDSATATLQWRNDGSSPWIDAGIDAVFTSNNKIGVFLDDGQVRVTITNAGGSTSLTSKLGGLE